jgi:hypothetical protein
VERLEQTLQRGARELEKHGENDLQSRVLARCGIIQP